MFLRKCEFCLVLGIPLGEDCAFVKLTSIQGVSLFVGFQLTFGDLKHFDSHIGAVVGGALKGGQQIVQHEALLHSYTVEFDNTPSTNCRASRADLPPRSRAKRSAWASSSVSGI